MKAKFEAIQSILSYIKALPNLNPIILNYVNDELDPFVTTQITQIENEIRYFFITLYFNQIILSKYVRKVQQSSTSPLAPAQLNQSWETNQIIQSKHTKWSR